MSIPSATLMDTTMRFTSETPETFESITRPVAYDIARTIGKLMHLPSSTKILFTGTSDQGAQIGSTLDYQGAPSAFPGNSRIEVTLSENTDDTNVFAETPLQNNAPTVFLDRSLAVQLRPIYASLVLTLSFNVRSRSRNEAEKIRDEYRIRSSGGRQQILHALTYSYSIPDDQLALLKQIYAMREAVAGYGDDFDTWLKKHSSNRLTTLTTLTGKEPLYAFGERQIGVQGLFDFHVSPEAPDRADPDGTYNYPIEYRVRYDKVIGMSLDYPLVVHNQMIPAQYHGPVNAAGYTPQPYVAKCSYSDLTNAVFRKLFLNKELTPCPIDGLRYPGFDDWYPAAVPSHTSTVYSCIIQVDPNDLNDVVDLKALTGGSFDGDVLQYMTSQGPSLGKLDQSAIHVSLFDGANWMGDSALTVSSDLKVRSTAPLCLRNRYHLRVAVLNDLLRLPSSAWLQLRTYGIAAQKILLTLQQKLPNGQYVPRLQGPNVIPDSLLRDCAIRINRYKGNYATGLECRMLTVANLFIVAKRLNDYADHAASTGDGAPSDPSTDPNYEPVVSGDCDECAAQSSADANKLC